MIKKGHGSRDGSRWLRQSCCCYNGAQPKKMVNKILKICSLPLTGKSVVDTIITELGVLCVVPDMGLLLVEIVPTTTAEESRKRTGAEFNASREPKSVEQTIR